MLGIDLSAMDREVRPQDDFFRYVNGTWMKTFPIPEDKSRYGAFDKLADASDEAVKALIEAASARTTPAERKVADFYESFINVDAIASKALGPLSEDLAAIRSLDGTPASFASLMGRLLETGMADSLPVVVGVAVDRKDTSRYIATLRQGGLGMPDRDYYSNEGEEAQGLRTKYTSYLATLLTLSGEAITQGWATPAAAAEAVFALETALAAQHWTKVQNRDVEKTYNKVAVSDLTASSLDFATFLTASKITPRPGVTHVIVAQPTFLEGLGKVLEAHTDTASWRIYFTARLLNAVAFNLPEPYVAAKFSWSQALSGQPIIRPRWQRGVVRVNAAVGELVGQIYVEQYFPAVCKGRMVALVETLREAYRERIQGLTWMGAATKAEAMIKLDKFRPMIGYPEKWIDYSTLELRADDLLGNLRRSSVFDHKRQVDKLGTEEKPNVVDRTEWFMQPQTVNAYYNPTVNGIVFPAAILQPPFFNMDADDAVNYGAIGAVIGHEMGHGFDDQGSKCDGEGMLRNWWTEDDTAAFKIRTANLVKQFGAYEPLPGAKVNGELTLGENIGDLGGLTVAHHAYRMSLKGRDAPIIDGLTGDQRFFMGWAQVWRLNIREKALRTQVMVDPHSPAEYRVNGVVCNMPEFHEAFGVKEGDKLFLPEGERVGIW